MFVKGLRSFQRGTVGLCRSTGFKITSCQSWRMILSSRNPTQAALVWFDSGRGQTLTLTPVDLQRPTVPLWKDLNHLNIIISIQRTRWIFNVVFDHLHRAYLLGVWYSFFVTVWHVLPSFPNILIVHTFLQSRCWRLNSKLLDQLSFTGQCFKGNWFSGAFSLCPRQRKQQVAAASVYFCGAIFKFQFLTSFLSD